MHTLPTTNLANVAATREIPATPADVAPPMFASKAPKLPAGATFTPSIEATVHEGKPAHILRRRRNPARALKNELKSRGLSKKGVKRAMKIARYAAAQGAEEAVNE